MYPDWPGWGGARGDVPNFLLVEDQPAVARGIVRVLRAYGSTEVVKTVAAAVRAVRDPAREWAALFVDIALPDGSGFDVLTQARAVHDSLPMLVMTGRDDTATANRAFDLGANCLLKPIEGSRIAAFVERSQARSSQAKARRAAVVSYWRRLYRLTPTETLILGKG